MIACGLERAACNNLRMLNARSVTSCGSGGMGGMVIKPYIRAKRVNIRLVKKRLGLSHHEPGLVQAFVIIQMGSRGRLADTASAPQSTKKPGRE